MTELRWQQRTMTEDGKVVCVTGQTLQYRTQTGIGVEFEQGSGDAIETILWSDWRDVPTVAEDAK